jgi:hypothetical protein
MVVARLTSTPVAAPASSAPSRAAAGGIARRAAVPSPEEAPPSLDDASVISGRASEDAGAQARARLRAAWGSGRDELGHARPQEGNAEGPMSFALAGKDLLVVDQINGRLVRYDEEGRVIRTTSIASTVQDVAVTKDGHTLLLDRLGEGAVTLIDASGREAGRLSLAAAGIKEPGMVTGLFVDGSSVYVEQEHGALVRLGTADGEPANGDAKDQLAGRPSKDGSLLLTAVISSRPGGRVVVNAFDRKTASLRFARAVSFPRPLEALALLDTDDRGVVYVGAASGGAGGTGRVTIACLDPADGHALGFVVVPHGTTPDESFRDFAVGGDGTIVYALRTESGVDYLTARCP